MSEPSSENQPVKKREGSSLLNGVEVKKLIEFGLAETDEVDDDFFELPGYKVAELIGQGGMGKVFLGTQLSLHRKVAIKIISLGGCARELMLDRLEREAHIMAKLSHPNLVSVIDFIELEDQNSAIVMEWIDGGTLQISHERQRSIAEIVRIGKQIASCLAAAHEVGVVHRDIKPSNLIVDSRGDIRVTDFGLALDDDARELRLTASGDAVGTMGYVAPEQLQGKPVDHRSDLYSLGVVLYELITGELPVGDFKTPKKFRPETPKSLDRLVVSLLQQQPRNRPKTATEVVFALERENSNPPRRAGLIAAMCLLVILGGGFGLWNASQKETQPSSINLLEGNTQKIRSTSTWKKQDEGYLTGFGLDLLGLWREPLDLPVTLRTSFSRLHGKDAISIFFRHPNGFGGVELATWRKNYGGLGDLDGVTIKSNPDVFVFPIKNDRRYLLEIRIDHDVIETFIDGEKMQTEWIGDRKLTPSVPWEWEPGETDDWTVMIGSFRNPVHFHFVELTKNPIIEASESEAP